MVVSKAKPLRLALMLASIHTGSSEALWSGIADTAEASGQVLFVFPGGRLDAPGEFEYLRNSIYRLINHETVDALVSWGSSLIGTVDFSQAIAFHKQFLDLPLVTIALPMPGAHVVSFDAYQGMKSLVLHCIRTHGATRLAFVRGPENHGSAEDRYRAYLDALSESDLPILPQLISSPCPWHEGDLALSELIEERKLVPGRDFTMVCCASDMLMLNAAKVLERKGFGIPRDVGIVGFNDSVESRFLSVPGTTVRVPFSELGKVAHKVLMDSLVGTPGSDDIILPAQPVIRYSCGCLQSMAGKLSHSGCFGRAELHSWAIRYFALDQERQNAYLEPLLDALYRGVGNQGISLFPLLSKVLERYFQDEPDTSAFQQTAEAVSALEDLDPSYLESIVRRGRALALETQSRLANKRSYEFIQQAELLNAFKCDLLKAWNRQSLVAIMLQHLPKLGVSQAYLVMNENDTYSRYVGGYRAQVPIGTPDELFPSHRLLPQQIDATCGPGVYLVQPLFIENQALGYVITAIADRNALKHEELRSSISSALKGVLLFEEMAKAKDVAERAEQAELDFFASMGASLKEPVCDFIGRMEILHELVAEESVHTGRVGHAISSLSHDMRSYLEHTKLLFDQTLAQAGSLELDRVLVAVDPLLTDVANSTGCLLTLPMRLPLVVGDKRRLEQLFSLVIASFPPAYAPVRIHVGFDGTGLHLDFQGSQTASKDAESITIVPFIESLILLHGGTYTRQETSFEMVLPWPKLGEPGGDHAPSTSKVMLVLSGGLEVGSDAHMAAKLCQFELENLSVEQLLQSPADVPEGALLYWDADLADTAQFLAMVKVSRHHALFSIPLVAFGTVLEGEPTLMYAVEKFLRSYQRGPVLVWKDMRHLPLCNALHLQPIVVTGIEQLAGIVEEVTPTCLVVRGFDSELIKLVRQSVPGSVLPLVVIVDTFPPEAEMAAVGDIPHLLLCHGAVSGYPEFCERIREIGSNGEILSAHTGILVKRAQRYMETHAKGMVTRWKIAESVNTSEDYLTRIFKKELGMSPWEYLSRYRVELSVKLLQETDLPLSEIAMRCGFQDQAYYCRVFKKLKHATPGSLRLP